MRAVHLEHLEHLEPWNVKPYAPALKRLRQLAATRGLKLCLSRPWPALPRWRQIRLWDAQGVDRYLSSNARPSRAIEVARRWLLRKYPRRPGAPLGNRNRAKRPA